MRIVLIGAVAILSFCLSCDMRTLSGTPRDNSSASDGAVTLSISLMRPGVLAKRAATTPERLILSLSAQDEETITDTITLEGDYTQGVEASFTALTAPCEWLLSAVVEDNNGMITHEGSTRFDVTPGNTATVALTLPAAFSNLVILLPTLQHAIDLAEFWFDEEMILRKAGNAPLEIAYDYISTNTLHTIELKLYSIDGEDTTGMYIGSTEVETKPGENRKLQMLLHYIGPTSGIGDITTEIGEIGEVVIIATDDPENNHALHFTTNAVSVAASESNTITGSLSISAWVRIESNPSGFGSIVCKWDDLSGAQRRSFALTLMRDRSARFDVDATGSWGTGSYWSGIPDEPIISSGSGNALLISKTKVSLSQWTHVAGIFDADSHSMQLYVNGELECEVTTEFSSILDTDEPILIGAGDLGGQGRQYLNGDLDEISLWDRPLTPEEVATLAGGTPLDTLESGLKAYWDFNEGMGSTVYDSSPNWNKGLFIAGAGGTGPEWFLR